MKHFTKLKSFNSSLGKATFLRKIVTVFALFFLVAQHVKGQTYATATSNRQGTYNCLASCGVISGVTNADNARDGSNADATKAVVKSSATLAIVGAQAFITLRFTDNVPAQKTVYVKIDQPESTGLLSSVLGFVGLIDNNRIFGQLTSGADATSDGTNVPTASTKIIIDKTGAYYLAITPAASNSTSFNGVRINVATPLDVVSSVTLNVYNAFYYPDGTTPADCGLADYTSLGESTGLTVSLFDAIFQPQNAIDGNFSTASELGTNLANVGVFSTLSQTILFKKPSAATDKAVVYLSTGMTVLDLSIFGGLTVQAFNGANSAGPASALSSLLDLNLLGLSVTGFPQNTLIPFSYTPTSSFDRIVITLSSGVNLSLFDAGIFIHEVTQVAAKPSLSSKIVYQLGAATPSVTATSTGNSIFWRGPLPAQTNLTVTAQASAASFPVSVSSNGDYVAVAVKTGCSLNASDSTKLRVIVLADASTTLPKGVAGVAFPAGGIIKATSSGHTFTYSASGLPTGLSINPNTGEISGTTATTGTFSVIVTVFENGVSTGIQLTKSLDVYPLMVANGTGLPNGIEGLTYGISTLPAPTGGSGSGFVYSVTTGALPTGLTLNANGTITGTPTTDGTYGFTVTISDPTSGQSVQQVYSNVKIFDALAANPATLPNGVENQAYPVSSIPAPTGGSGSGLTYALTTGALPAGLTLNANGTFSGTPNTDGTYNFTVTITDPTSGQSIQQAYSNVKIFDALVANPATLPDGITNQTYGATVIPAPTGGSGSALTYALTSGALPTGLSLAANGTLTGPPTASGTYNFTVTITDPGSGQSIQQVYSDVDIFDLLVANPATFPNSYVGASSYSLAAVPVPTGGSGSTGSYTYLVTDGALPNGLFISSAGVITGSTTAAGTFSFNIQVTDPASAQSVTQVYTGVVVSPALVLAGGTFPSTSATETVYSQSVTGLAGGGASGGKQGATYVYSATPGSLPTSFTLSANGTLAGDPSQVANAANSFTIFVTDGEQTVSAGFSLTVNGALPVTLVSFEVSKENSVALIKWSTTSEINSEKFSVERSSDGRTWITLGAVDASGESSAIVKYNYSDNQPMKGENLYRLRMIDRDGTFAYSRIASIMMEGNSGLTLYPNPIRGNESLNFSVSDWSKIESVKIYNSFGKVIYFSTDFVNGGIALGDVSSGLYIAKIVQKDGSVVTAKFFKL